MKQLICEMCGSNDLIKEDGVFVCKSCGCKYSVEEAKKMMVEGTVDVTGSTVKIDGSEELANLYQVARRARDDGNSENAQKYYEQIIVKDPSSWEANFYTVYFQSMNCKVGEVGVAAARLMNCESAVFRLIRDNVTDDSEQRKAVDEVAAKLIFISNMLFNAYKNHYDGIDSQIRYKFTQEYANNCSLCRDVAYKGGNTIISVFGDKYSDIAVACWKLGVRQHNILNGVFDDKKGNAVVIDSYNEKIKKYDSSYQAPQTNMNRDGCYIATAVYGSYDCPQVWTLRRFRDSTLAETWYGRTFIYTYYTISPTLVKIFGNTEWFKKMWKGILDRMIEKLKAEGIEDTPYKDKNWRG